MIASAAKRAFARSASIGLALVVVAAPALAVAPSDQYQFFNRDDTEIVDNFTRLTWERNVVVTATLAAARTHCASYGGGGYRLPTVKELMTLVDEQVHEEYENGALAPKAIDPNAFPHTPSAQFWTDTPSAGGAKYWTVDFHDGTTAAENPALSFPVRCVK